MTEIILIHGPHTVESIQIGSIYGIGLNYADHIAEMQSVRAREPVVFMKPATSLLPEGGGPCLPCAPKSMPAS